MNARMLLLWPAVLVALSGLTTAAYGDLVVNGGFETGDFSGWTVSPSAMGGTYAVDNTGTYSHSGTCAAALGPYGADGFLSQSIPTTAGQQYQLTYWLANIPDAGGSVWNNDFEVSWGGAEIMASAILNAGPFSYTKYSFVVTGAAGSTPLSFGLRQDAKFFALDDVSVVLPEPATLSLLALGGLAMIRKRRE